MRSIRSALLSATVLFAVGDAARAQSVAAAGSLLPVFHALALTTAVAGTRQVEFDVLLPLRDEAGLDALLVQQQTPGSAQYHRWLTPAGFAARFGPATATMMQAAIALRLFGLQVTPQSRSLHVVGTAAQVNAAFNISLMLASTPSGRTRFAARQAPSLPGVLAGTGAIVSAFSPRGFDASPFVRQKSLGYVRQKSLGYGSTGPAGGMFYNDLKQFYRYPSYQATVTVAGHAQRLDGTGTTVAVLMAGDVLDSDVAALFDYRNFTAVSGQSSAPGIAARRPVNGGAAFSATDPGSEEATVDVQQVLGGAPGARLVLYDTPDLSDQSLISGYTAILNDNTADVVSMSFGQCEKYYTATFNDGQDQTATLATFSQLFKQGNAQGMTFVAASGDSAGLGCISASYFSGGSGQFGPGVSVPAADPNVTAVGGTNIATDRTGTVATENAWSDPETAWDPYDLGTGVTGGVWGAGGGLSTLYRKPSYQSVVATGSSAFRALPDIGMQMGGCPDVAQAPCNGGNTAANGSGNTDRSAVDIVFNGDWYGAIGTSAAAPAMASAVALLVEMQGRQGNINPMLYALAQAQAQQTGGQAVFNQSVPGFNGLVGNTGTFNYTTGNGTPNVSALLGLASGPTAGVPGSASNP